MPETSTIKSGDGANPGPGPTPFGSSNRAAKCKYYGRLFLAHLFSHVGLCGLVVGYAVVGAITFEALESPNEVVQRSTIKTHREKCLEDLWKITLEFNVLYESNWTQKVGIRLKDFELSVVGAVKDNGYDGKESEDNERQWSFSGALLYCITVITTIGYGNIAPKTDVGKVVTIFYALLGIPLMLMCLSNIGNLLAHSFKFTYSRICCAIFRDRNSRSGRKTIYRQSTKSSGSNNKEDTQLGNSILEEKDKFESQEKIPLNTLDIVLDTKELSSGIQCPSPNEPPPLNTKEEDRFDDKIEDTSPVKSSSKFAESPTNHVSGKSSGADDEIITVETTTYRDDSPNNDRVPIYMVLVLVTAYICGGATLFSLWEDWTFLNGAYFCFITLSTIGFGDLVPGGSIFGGTDGENGQAKLIICCFYLILGLSVIAMSFNLVQEEVIIKCKNIARNLGILSSEDQNN